MVNLTINQLIQALEASVKHEGLQEFGVVIQQLHGYSLAKDKNKIIQKIDELVDKYSDFDWRESIKEAEPEPYWILSYLPTRHNIKLEGSLYLKFEEYLRKSVFPQPLKPKEIENKMDQLLNELLKNFLQSQQYAKV